MLYVALLLPSKDTMPATIKHVQAAVEHKIGKKLYVLCTDRGGEVIETNFIDYCAKLGMQRELTVPYSTYQNGVVEHRNQPIVGTVLNMLKAKGLPVCLPPQSLFIQEPCWQDPLQAVDWEHTGGAPSPHIFVHRSCQSDHAEPQEAQQQEPVHDLHQL